MPDSAERVRRLADRRGTIQNRDVVAALRVSPATAHRLLQALVTSGVLQRVGAGRAASYRLRGVRRRYRRAKLDEHPVWERVAGGIFARRHPEVTLEPVGMSQTVAFMVARARALR